MEKDKKSEFNDTHEDLAVAIPILDVDRSMMEISACLLDFEEVDRITNALEPDQQRGPSESP